jgi:aryl-alcohol dehydrogenase-like predicted oxidoreductase
MQYKTLGDTGLLVSQLCFGCMTFHGGTGMFKAIGSVDQAGADALVKSSIEAGINFFDTADVYSEGESEKTLGQSLKNLNIARKDVVLATKVYGRVGPGRNDIGASRGHIMDSIDGSLRRLQTDHIDLYQIHGNDSVTPLDETLRALDDLVTSGKVRYLGVSNWQAWKIAKALTISHLAGGLLSGKFSRDNQKPADSRRSNFDFPLVDKERTWNILDAIAPIAKAHNCSAARISLAWLLAKPVVTSIIIGAKRLDQLEDNIAATELTLTSDELKQLDEVSALPPEYPGWMLQTQGSNRLDPNVQRFVPPANQK